MLTSVAAELAVPLVPLGPLGLGADDNAEYFIDALHFSPAGHALMARTIVEYLKARRARSVVPPSITIGIALPAYRPRTVRGRRSAASRFRSRARPTSGKNSLQRRSEAHADASAFVAYRRPRIPVVRTALQALLGVLSRDRDVRPCPPRGQFPRHTS